MAASPTTPPTTPPAMAPVLVPPPGVTAGADDVVVEVTRAKSDDDERSDVDVKVVVLVSPPDEVS